MSHGELAEHQQYLLDERRNMAYRAALAEIVGPDDVVLDLGAGTGLLGYLACDAGAKEVIALDRGEILGLARRIAADNGYADRIRHVQALSTEMELDEPADVVVCDQIGGLVHDAGILWYFADARQRLMAPGGRLLPSAFRIFAAPVTFELGRAAVDFWGTKPSSIDVSTALSIAANTEWHYSVTVEELALLAAPRELASFASDHVDPITGSAEFEVDQPGRFDGFLGWFEAQLSPSVTLTNDPWSPDRFDRWCNFYPVDEAVDVREGDRIDLRLDIRPRLEVVSWRTVVTPRNGRARRMTQSTFQSALLTAASLSRSAVDQAIPRSDRISAMQAVIDLIDGSHTQREIVEALSDRVGTDFTSSSHLENFVRKVTNLSR